MENYNSELDLSQASDLQRADFYKKTYLHVAIAFLAFILLEYVLLSIPAVVSLGFKMTQGWTWLLVIGAFSLVTNYAEKLAAKNTDKRTQYLGFGLAVFAQAFIFVPLISIALMMGGGETMLQQAFLVTLFLFVALTVYANALVYTSIFYEQRLKHIVLYNIMKRSDFKTSLLFYFG